MSAGGTKLFVVIGALLLTSRRVHAQAPEGPMTPAPEVKIQQPPPKRTIKLRSILVNTPVTVLDAKGEMVHTLQQGDFHITDNGVEQKITHFDLGGDPISLAVVVETSSRIEALMPGLRKTGIVLSQAVTGPTGETAIIGFNDSVEKLLDFTADSEKVERTMAQLKEGTSGTKLYDAMALAVEMLSKQPEVSAADLGHRRVMLVVAEAHDQGSDAKLGEVLREAQLRNITIYSVGLSNTRAMLQKKPEYKRPPNPVPDGIAGLPTPPGTVQTPTTQNDQYGNIDLLALAVWAVEHIKDKIVSHALEVSATATGGEHYATWRDRSIEKAMDDIGGELHSQYTLTYAPTGTSTEGYHEITVRVSRTDLTVRARPGYYLAAPES
jgi:VWFA-related protein